MLEACPQNSKDGGGKEKALILARVAWRGLPEKQLLDLGAKEQAPLPMKDVESKEFLTT